MDNNPEMENSGRHDLPFSSQIFIEQEDYMDDPPPKFFRLTKGGMARLRSAYIIECIDVEYSSEGTPTKLLCRYIPESKSGQDTSGLKVKTTIHWVEMSQAIDVDLNLYDRLFTVEEPDKQEGDFKAYLN
jgi:glutaminyl-tRNA synthetase